MCLINAHSAWQQDLHYFMLRRFNWLPDKMISEGIFYVVFVFFAPEPPLHRPSFPPRSHTHTKAFVRLICKEKGFVLGCAPLWSWFFILKTLSRWMFKELCQLSCFFSHALLVRRWTSSLEHTALSELSRVCFCLLLYNHFIVYQLLSLMWAHLIELVLLLYRLVSGGGEITLFKTVEWSHVGFDILSSAQQGAGKISQRFGCIFASRYHAVAAVFLAAHDAKHSPHPSDAQLDGNLVAL